MTILALMQSTDYSGYVRLMEVMNRYHHESLPEVFLPGPIPMLTQNEYWLLIGRDDRRLIGAFDEGQLCGFVQVRRVEPKPNKIIRSEASCHVDEIIVDPGFRRRGVAQKLLEAAETLAAEQGIAVLSLTVFEFNDSARGFYEHSGYATQDRTMRKRLDQSIHVAPKKIQIRAATLTDVPGIAKVHVDVWNTTYSGIVPQTFLDSRTYETTVPVSVPDLT